MPHPELNNHEPDRVPEKGGQRTQILTVGTPVNEFERLIAVNVPSPTTPVGTMTVLGRRTPFCFGLEITCQIGPLSACHGSSYICSFLSIEDASGCATEPPSLSPLHRRYKIHFRSKRITGNVPGTTIEANSEMFRKRENIAHVDSILIRSIHDAAKQQVNRNVKKSRTIAPLGNTSVGVTASVGCNRRLNI